MPFKAVVVWAVFMVAVSLAAQQKDDPAKEDKPLSEGNEHLKLDDVRDVLIQVLSFCPPINWAWLRRVNSVFNVCLRTTIGRHFEQHGVPLDPTVGFKAMVCSEEWKMEDVLKSVMDKPGFRGAIFNKDECTLINHSLRGSQVCSESEFKGRVRITGVVDVEECFRFDQSKCNDIFLYRVYPNLHARNIRTGKDITIDFIDTYAKSIMANEKQLVIVEEYRVLMYELNWKTNKANRVLREFKEIRERTTAQISTDESGDVSSVFCLTKYGFYKFDIMSKQWNSIQFANHNARISPDGKIVFKSFVRTTIETIDGKTTLLEIPQRSYFYPSPDSQFVCLVIPSICGMMNLRSSEITVVSDITFFHDFEWISDNLIRARLVKDRRTLRCAHNPCVDLVTLNEDDSLIERVMVNDEVDASDLFYQLERIGPNFYYSEHYQKVIQVEWIGNHKH